MRSNTPIRRSCRRADLRGRIAKDTFAQRVVAPSPAGQVDGGHRPRDTAQ
jgi:hypothetical protein